MRVRVVNKKLSEGKNTLVNVTNTFGADGNLVATRVESYFPNEEAAIERLKSFGLEPNDDIQIIPLDSERM